MRRIIVPARPGAFSALGLLCTDVLHDYIRSELCPLDRLDPAHAEEHLSRDRGQGGERTGRRRPRSKVQRRTGANLICAMRARVTSCACRSTGFGKNTLDAKALEAARARFDDLHARIHGHAAKEKGVEVVSYRHAGAGECAEIRAASGAARPTRAAAGRSRQGARRVFFTRERGSRAEIYDRDQARLSAPHLPAPPSSSSSTQRPWCRRAGTRRWTATAISFWSGRAEVACAPHLSCSAKAEHPVIAGKMVENAKRW